MIIDKDTLFDSTKALWPVTVNVSDPNATWNIYESNEQACSASDNWRQIALWSFHQALKGLEEHALAKGLSVINPHDVTFAEFDTWMRENLNGDGCWLEERAQYEGEPSGTSSAPL